MGSEDGDIRARAFVFLDELRGECGDALPRERLERGFEFRGRRVPLVGPQGIFKPAVMAHMPLSITTSPISDRKRAVYEDRLGNDGFIEYEYRGTDPLHHENVGLRMASGLSGARRPRGHLAAAAFALVAPEPMLVSGPRPKVTPLAPERFGIQFTISQATRDKLKRAQELASHTIRPGVPAQLFDTALDVLIAKLERRKCGMAQRRRNSAKPPTSEPTAGRRHVPARVKSEVWARDGGQCTFVSAAGQRCPSRELVEFDHIDPVALGGRSTTARMRLLCRAHNQYAAECELGVAFMNRQRMHHSFAPRLRSSPARTVQPTRSAYSSNGTANLRLTPARSLNAAMVRDSEPAKCAASFDRSASSWCVV